MRPLPQMRNVERIWKKAPSTPSAWVWTTVLLATSAWTLGCGGGGAGSVTPPPPPPPSITVSVTPSTGAVLLGETFSFSAVVSNTTDTAVIWSVNGVAGGSAQAGTISADGIYTAPADIPSGGTVQVTATCHADTSKSATASVTVTSDVSVSLSLSAANVELGATQAFQASIKSQGRPDPSVRWSLSGPSCPSACGAVDASGNYTAPQTLPGNASVSVTATSVADPVSPSDVSNALVTLCRNATTDPGWPPSQACVVPPVNTQFTTRTRPER